MYFISKLSSTIIVKKSITLSRALLPAVAKTLYDRGQDVSFHGIFPSAVESGGLEAGCDNLTGDTV